MKILFISSGFDISFNGGITNYVRGISDALIKKGHEVFVLDSTENGSIEQEYLFKRIKLKNRLKPFHLRSIIKNKDLENIRNILENISPDVIHIHMMIDLPIGIIDVCKSFSKTIISLHDYSFICNRVILIDSSGEICSDSRYNTKCNDCIKLWEMFNTNRVIMGVLNRVPFLKKKLFFKSFGHDEYYKALKRIFENVDALLAVSMRVREVYLNHGINNNKFLVNHIGNYTADKSFFNLFYRKEKTNNDTITFGYMGNFLRSKGADLILKIADKLIDRKIVIYGRILEDYEPKIKKHSNIVYKGCYSHHSLPDILKEIDIGLVFSIWEDSAPQVVFEFLNAHIPVLATKIGGIPEFVNDDNGMLIQPNSEEDFSKLVNLMNSKELYKKYNFWLNNIKPTKTLEEEADELIGIYKNL